ncbi:MAG: phosphatase domain-containing protein [Anaerolineales bacterium]
MKVDWQKKIARLAHTVEGIFDRIKYRVGARIHSANALMIMPYLGFGSARFIDLKGRVLEDSGIKPSKKTDRIWDNLLNMYRRFESDEVPNARVLASFEGIEQEITADEEGFFEVSIQLDKPLIAEFSWQKIDLELLEPRLSENGKVCAQGQAMIVSSQAEFGVISDIDDTVVYTGVTSRLKLASTVLLKNAYTRLPLKGVEKFYNALQQGVNSPGKNPLFYVSSSPWNMYGLFREFFKINNIPIGPIFLRDWGFERHSMLAVKNREYKLDAICNILESFPDLKFILIGDSGEEDPEIYSKVIQSFPSRILGVYIRDVKHDAKRVKEIRRLADRVESYGSMLVFAEDAEAMARHAAQQGWIVSSAVSQPVK